jgi:type IX secretion system PorP/SprF family membrane protein
MMSGRIGIFNSFVVLIMCTAPLCAQQDPMYSMYMFDKLLINPAFAGSSNWAVGTLKYREQAKSFQGHPVTETFNFHGPIQRKHIGLGFKVTNDQIPVQNTLNASLFFSYHLTFAGGKLSLGLEGGMIKKTIDFQDVILNTEGDNAIPANAVTNTMPDLSAGLYYQKKQFYFGLSSAHLLSSLTSDAQNPVVGPAQHAYLLLGNVFQLGSDVTLEPSILARYSTSALPQADGNLMLYFFDRFGLGAQYRSNEAISGIVRIEPIRGLRIAYSYDYGFKSTQSFVHGSHEIILSYGVKLAPPPARKEVHPRYYF